MKGDCVVMLSTGLVLVQHWFIDKKFKNLIELQNEL